MKEHLRILGTQEGGELTSNGEIHSGKVKGVSKHKVEQAKDSMVDDEEWSDCEDEEEDEDEGKGDGAAMTVDEVDEAS